MIRRTLMAVCVAAGMAACGSPTEPTPTTQYVLTVARSGGGAGSVASAPAGIDCGASCTVSLDEGTTVTLTAEASPGSVFEGWTGGGCSGVDPCDVSMTTATTVTAQFNSLSFAATEEWFCEVGDTCQDVYDFDLPANTVVSIGVGSVTGRSVLRLGAFGPGSALSGINLLTGLSRDRECTGQDAGDHVQFRTGAAGTYRIAVARDWGSSSGETGTYALTVSTEDGLVAGGRTVSDAVAESSGSQCGYTYEVDGEWECASGVSCQDVFAFSALAATRVTVSVTNVTGFSVVRMAVFEGTAIDTTNRLTNGLSDRRCSPQDTDDADTSSILIAGEHRFAVGRDWGSSANEDGTYRVTLTTDDVPLSIGEQVVDDEASAFATTVCS